MLSSQQKARLKAEYAKGNVKVLGVSPEGVVTWCRVLDVQRAEVGPENIYQGHTSKGVFTLTGGHRVFVDPTTKMEMEALRAGQDLLCVQGETAYREPIASAPGRVADRQYMYDLTAEHWHNFVLHHSGLVISNSPDKFYHFRPPEHEGTLKNYNQVFGEIWEDDELHEYLQRSVDWWNMMPPATGITLEEAVTARGGAWRTAILWGAITHACTALALNWIADEFSLGYDTLVYVRTANEEVELDIPMGMLWELLYYRHLRDDQLHVDIQTLILQAQDAGELLVVGVDKLTGVAGYYPVFDVVRHPVGKANKRCVRVETVVGDVVECTEDHSLFRFLGKNRVPAITELQGGKAVAGTQIVYVDVDADKPTRMIAFGVAVESLTEIPTPEYMYDLSVPGPENFMLSNGILAHNSYSIGGISLDLEKSSKYEGIKSNAEGQLDKATEAKQLTVKYTRGLQQHRYSGSAHAALGPSTRAGLQGPRNFVGGS